MYFWKNKVLSCPNWLGLLDHPASYVDRGGNAWLTGGAHGSFFRVTHLALSSSLRGWAHPQGTSPPLRLPALEPLWARAVPSEPSSLSCTGFPASLLWPSELFSHLERQAALFP